MKILFIAMVLFPVFGFAQDVVQQIRQAKYNIIKAAVDCYSKDIEGFPDFNKNVSLDCDSNAKDYGCLVRYCDDAKLMNGKNNSIKVSGFVKEWAADESITDTTKLKNFRNKILAKISTPNRKGKYYLEQFKESTDQQIASIKNTPPAGPERTVNTDNAIGDGMQESQVQAMIDSSIKQKLTVQSSNLPMLALILSLLSLMGVAAAVLYYNHDKNKQLTSQSNLNTQDRERLVKWMEERLGALTPQTAPSSKAGNAVSPGSFEKRLVSIEKSLERMENELHQLSTRPAGNASNQGSVQEAVPEAVVPAAPAPELTVLYAKLPDIGEGKGFSPTVLVTIQNGEQIYQLETSGLKGTYFVSNDPKAQKYAMNNPADYLSKACDFINQPQKDCRIYTTESGTVIKSGNNWMIEGKAKIEFS